MFATKGWLILTMYRLGYIRLPPTPHPLGNGLFSAALCGDAEARLKGP